MRVCWNFAPQFSPTKEGLIFTFDKYNKGRKGQPLLEIYIYIYIYWSVVVRGCFVFIR